MKRTLENCSLIKKMGIKPNQYDGRCEGISHSEYDDEPCDICQECKLHYIYDDEVRFWQNEAKGC